MIKELLFLSLIAMPVQNEQSFINEVNNIRELKGLKPVKHSKRLQTITEKHSVIIKENKCDLMRKEKLFVSALSTFRIIKPCKNGLCDLDVYNQSVKDEAWSLAYRQENNLYGSVKIIGVSLAKCNKKIVIITTTE
jgi:hypothetical protein